MKLKKLEEILDQKEYEYEKAGYEIMIQYYKEENLPALLQKEKEKYAKFKRKSKTQKGNRCRSE